MCANLPANESSRKSTPGEIGDRMTASIRGLLTAVADVRIRFEHEVNRRIDAEEELKRVRLALSMLQDQAAASRRRAQARWTGVVRLHGVQGS